MPLPMARPVKIKDSPNSQYRTRIPRDVLDKARGQTVTVEIDDRPVSFRIGPTGAAVKFSLRTSIPHEIRARHRAVAAQVSDWFDMLRTGITTLSQRDAVALAGEWYRWFTSQHSEEPGSPGTWSRKRECLIDNHLRDGDETPAGLELEARTDQFLAERGVVLSPAARSRFMAAMAYEYLEATKTLGRRAGGDYSADAHLIELPPPLSNGPAKEALTFDSLIDGWAREAEPKQSTVDQWRSQLRNLVEVTGITDATRLTAEHVIQWKDALLDRLAAKTINDSYLASLSKVLNWAVENRKLPANVAKGVRVNRKRKPSTKMLGYSDEQASVILAAASASTTPAYRWLPWLCAMHGGRVGEFSQLRKSDIRKDRSGIHYMYITGEVKNEGSERDVPLHPHLIKLGFLSFVESHKDGPLFFDPSKRRKADAKKPQSKIVNKDVAAWVKELGVEGVGRVRRVDPSHAWRHRFKTECSAAGIQDRVSDAITGHAPRTEGQAYGDVTLTTKFEAVKKIRPPHGSEVPTLAKYQS